MQIQLNNRTILLCTVVALGGYALVRGGGTLDGIRGLAFRGADASDASDAAGPPGAGVDGRVQPVGMQQPAYGAPQRGGQYAGAPYPAPTGTGTGTGDDAFDGDTPPNAPNGSGVPNGSTVPGGAGGRSYRDPGGRFSLRVPDGWRAAPQNGGVVLTRGDANVVVSPFGGATSGEQVVGVLAQQYGQQWRGLQLVNRGQYALGGVPSAYAMFQGADPRGRPMLLRLVGAVGPNGALAVILSVPSQEFSALAPTLQAIETSVAWR